MPLDDATKALYRRRIENAERLFDNMSLDMRAAVKDFFATSLDEAKVAVGMTIRDGLDDENLFYDFITHRYLVLQWVEYDNQFDEINPEDAELFCDTPDAALALVETHVCRNEPPDYAYRCRVYDLDTGTELLWEEVRKVKWVRPWAHLTAEQRQKIEDTALADVVNSCNSDRGFKTGVLRSYVKQLSLADQLETIGEDATELLGFDPETGEACVSEPEPESVKPVPTVTWGRTTAGTRTWHAFVDGTLKANPKTKGSEQVMTKYTGLSLCGINGVNVVGPISMAIGETPAYGGNSAVCEKCKQFVPDPKE